MNARIIFAGVGCLGGLTKSLVGILKAKSRGEKIKFGYVFRTLKLSILSGTVIGAVVNYNYAVSFIAGYIGSDLLEGLYLSFRHTKLWKNQFRV